MSKQVLLTGCSSGIGLALAQGLYKRNYQVLTTARKTEDIKRLEVQGFKCFALEYGNNDSVQRLVQELEDQPLYALINNGAYGQPGAIEDLSREALREQFEANLFGWHQLTAGLLPKMRQQGDGRIIQISSVLGLVAMPYRGAYVASKFALEGLSDTLRMELLGSGIQVSIIEPGPIESKFRENAYRAFVTYIDADKSLHCKAYRAMSERLLKPGPAMPFTLPADALLKPVIHALESRNPKARYAVTLPTHLLALLKRLLPTRVLDRLLAQSAENRKTRTH